MREAVSLFNSLRFRQTFAKDVRMSHGSDAATL